MKDRSGHIKIPGFYDEVKPLEEAGKLVPDYKGIPVGKMVDDLIMPRIEEVESAI